MIRFAASCLWYPGRTAEEKIRLAAEAGFAGLEDLCWVGNDPASVKAALDRYGVTETAVILQSVDPVINRAVGQHDSMARPGAMAAYEQAFRETLAYVKQVGIDKMIAVPGETIPTVSREAQTEASVKVLSRLGRMAEDEGVRILLEPLNVLVDHKGQFLSTTADGVRMVREAGSSAVSLLYDVYHQQVTEGNLIATIRENSDFIGHFHMADVPGRRECGTGEINYPNVLRAIGETGYDGWISFECFLSGETDGEKQSRIAAMRSLVKPFER